MIDVIVPVYNGAAYLARAIRSIAGQARDDLRITVVDDGSTDGSGDVARGLGVHVAVQPRAGPSAARNFGLACTDADRVTFLDADDHWTPDAVARHLAVFAAHPEVGCVLGYTQRIESDGRMVTPPGPVLQLGAGLYRRTVFDRVGGFNEALWFGEDVDWFMRAREAGILCHFHKHVSLLYCRHETNMTLAPGRATAGLLGALKQSLDRRRQSQAPLAQWGVDEG